MKKIAALISAGAMLLSVAGPALAGGRPPKSNQSTINVANVTNVTYAGASTGGNSVGNSATVAQSGFWPSATVTQTNKVTTGDADALAVGVVAANDKVGCGCSPCGMCSGTKNIATVYNQTTASANTGGNSVGNSTGVTQFLGGSATVTQQNTVKTGAADADAVGVVVVNTQLSWMPY